MLPKGVTIFLEVNTSLTIIFSPPTDRIATPSGANILKSPCTVVDSLVRSEPIDSFGPLSGKSSSSTTASPPNNLGVKSVIKTGLSIINSFSGKTGHVIFSTF